jgi:hypothetical protein
MLRYALPPLTGLVLLAASHHIVLAQQAGPQSFDQYPSFIELTSTTPDGAKAVLRCGYSSANGATIHLEPAFRELSVINEAHKYYSRIQRVDDVLIATSTDPTGGNGLLLELIKPDGSVVAKSCQTDLNTDSIGNCKSVQNFTFADQVKAGDAKIATQCDDLVRTNGNQLNPSLASPQKTEVFMAALRQKVATLAAP